MVKFHKFQSFARARPVVESGGTLLKTIFLIYQQKRFVIVIRIEKIH